MMAIHPMTKVDMKQLGQRLMNAFNKGHGVRLSYAELRHFDILEEWASAAIESDFIDEPN